MSANSNISDKINIRYPKSIFFMIMIFLGSLFIYGSFKSEILVFLEFRELKNPNSNKYYYSTKNSSRIEITISEESNLDDVIDLLKMNGELKGLKYFKALADTKKYTDQIIHGTIILKGKYSMNELINSLKITKRATIQFQLLENIRLLEDMIDTIEYTLNFDNGELRKYIYNSSFLPDNNLTLETLPSLFIPNTYELYSGISPQQFLIRMKLEYNSFWNKDRLEKLDALNMWFYEEDEIDMIADSLRISKVDISILACIVEEEQARRIDERPRISGVYLNRLKNPAMFPFLQADPTVIFAYVTQQAEKNFNIKQVLDQHTSFDNHYNTYKYRGLPPGPIRIPSIHAIDAVLDSEDHDFYFMCAGSNGDGYHKFTSTNSEHNLNKSKYKRYQNLN